MAEGGQYLSSNNSWRSRSILIAVKSKKGEVLNVFVLKTGFLNTKM